METELIPREQQLLLAYATARNKLAQAIFADSQNPNYPQINRLIDEWLEQTTEHPEADEISADPVAQQVANEMIDITLMLLNPGTVGVIRRLRQEREEGFRQAAK